MNSQKDTTNTQLKDTEKQSSIHEYSTKTPMKDICRININSHQNTWNQKKWGKRDREQEGVRERVRDREREKESEGGRKRG